MASDEDPWVSAFTHAEPRARAVLGIGADVDPAELLDSFDRQQEIVVEAEKRLRDTEFTTVGGDGRVVVTMTGAGHISEIELVDDVYVRFRPRELGPEVLKTVNAAMARCGEIVHEAMRGVLGDETVLDEIMKGWPGRAAGDGHGVADWT